MGTRCLTHIKDKLGKTLLTIYRQSDGYISGHGLEIKNFCNDRALVNGISGSRNKCFNGMQCFAAALLCHLKLRGQTEIEAGEIYVYPADKCDVGEEYVYTIYPSDNSDNAQLMCKVEAYKKVIFEGEISDLTDKSDEEE